MCRPIQECPKCKQVKKMTIHHLLPKTHYKGAGDTVYVCRECHNKLEMIILQEEGRIKGKRRKLDPIVYYSIWNSFIKGVK